MLHGFVEVRGPHGAWHRANVTIPAGSKVLVGGLYQMACALGIRDGYRGLPEDLGRELAHLVELTDSGEAPPPGEALVGDACRSWHTLREFEDWFADPKPVRSHRFIPLRAFIGGPALVRLIREPGGREALERLVGWRAFKMETPDSLDPGWVESGVRAGNIRVVPWEEACSLVLGLVEPTETVVVRQDVVFDPWSDAAELRDEYLPKMRALGGPDDVRLIITISV